MPWLWRLIAGPSPRRTRFDPRPVHGRYMMYKVAFGHVSFRVIRFCPVIILLPMLRNYILCSTDKRAKSENFHEAALFGISDNMGPNNFNTVEHVFPTLQKVGHKHALRCSATYSILRQSTSITFSTFQRCTSPQQRTTGHFLGTSTPINFLVPSCNECSVCHSTPYEGEQISP